MKSNSTFAMLTGLAVGALLGLLLAPEKGADTRAKLRKAASEGYNELKDAVSDMADKVRDSLEEQSPCGEE